MYEESTPVLIVGGGPAGLSASLFLSWLGTPSVLVERHAGTSIHPRAWGWYPRTLELFRPSGVADAVLKESESFAGHNLNGKVESLAGRQVSISRIPDPEDVSDISPIPRIVSLPQDRMEPLLRRRAEELGGDLRFHTELRHFTAGEEGVAATVRDLGDGTERMIRARYLIAADGARGALGEQLGVRRRGRGTLRHQISVLFRADLRGPLGERRFAVCQVENPDVEGVLGHDDSLLQGTLIVTYEPRKGQRPADFSEDRCAELVRAAVGVPGLDVEIRGVLPWEMASLAAERFAAGPVFLAGDAAHVIPPVGGYGANTGIQDVHNLAWKLHAVLSGYAAPELLGTYDLERRPVAEATVEQAGLRLAVRAGFATPEQEAAVTDTLSVTSGYRYRSPAIVAEETEGEAREDASAFTHPRLQTGAPGTRAPHLRVRRNGTAVSIQDLFDRSAVLLTGDGAAWRPVAGRAAARHSAPIDVCVIGQDVSPIDGDPPWHRRYGVDPAGAALVRPDGFICWRSEPRRTPDGGLERAVAAMLGREAVR